MENLCKEIKHIRAQSEEAMIASSNGYAQAGIKTRKISYNFINDKNNINKKHSSLRIINKLANKCRKTLTEMVDELNIEINDEKELYPIILNYFNKILELLNINNMKAKLMYSKEYFTISRRRPDFGIVFNDMYKDKPGSLSIQLLGEIKCGFEKFDNNDKDIGEIIIYLRLHLTETQSSKAFGLVMNQKYIQFYQMNKNDKQTIFKSNIFEIQNNEWVKLMYYFNNDLSLKKEYLSKYIYPLNYFFDNNMSISCLCGTGASTVVYGVNYIENSNDNNNNNNNINNNNRKKIKKCLKMD